MAIFVSDTFTEASDTTLASHSPEVGGAWAKHTNFAQAATVFGATDKVGGTSDSNSSFYYNATAPGDNDLVLAADSSDAGSGSNLRAGVIAFKDVDATTDCYFAYLWENSSGQVQLAKFSAGVFTSLGTYTLGSTAAIALELRTTPGAGTTLEVKVNTVSRITSGDTDHASYANTGIFVRQRGRVDNFVASDGTTGGSTYNDTLTQAAEAATTFGASLTATATVSFAGTADASFASLVTKEATLTQASEAGASFAGVLTAAATLAQAVTAATAFAAALTVGATVSYGVTAGVSFATTVTGNEQTYNDTATFMASAGVSFVSTVVRFSWTDADPAGGTWTDATPNTATWTEK